MLAVVDAHSRFLLVDIGSAGRHSDSSLYMSSPIKRYFESGAAELPPPQQLGNVGRVPFVVLADGGFGLSEYVMIPFQQRAADTPAKRRYNTRLSR